MRYFVDASAMVAILVGEPDFHRLAEQLDAADERLWSAMSCWESINAVRRVRDNDVRVARNEVEAYALAKMLRLVAVGEVERAMALDAYDQYGKGRHPANLNMGDCFAYACAKANDARLLYNGDDFALTDLA